jgi:hypothetical protein
MTGISSCLGAQKELILFSDYPKMGCFSEVLNIGEIIRKQSFIGMVGGLGILGLVLDGSAVLAESAWTDAHKRRDYQLGVTLSEFRKIPFQDQKIWPNAFPVCSNDAQYKSYRFSDVHLYGTLKKVGLIKCQFYYFYSGRNHVAGVVLGDIPASTSFNFYPPVEGREPVLFKIETKGPSRSYTKVVSMFESAMGKPTESRTEQLRNRLGTMFANQKHYYVNKVSLIELSRFGRTLKQFRIEHVLTPVLKRFNDALKAYNREKSGKL